MSFPKFPIAKILILVTILAVPGFLYYLLQAKGKNRYKPLPVFGPKVLTGTFHKVRGEQIPDTAFHQISNAKFLSSSGDSLSFADFKGKLVIVNFFYSRNKETVPAINEKIVELRDEFGDNKIIRFLSISIDPQNDNLSIIEDYAKSLGAQSKKWDIVVADTSVVYPFAREQFFVNALKSNANDNDFIFSDKLILIDAEQRIRGYYTGTSYDDTKRLSDEIKVLITEELRKIKAE